MSSNSQQIDLGGPMGSVVLPDSGGSFFDDADVFVPNIEISDSKEVPFINLGSDEPTTVSGIEVTKHNNSEVGFQASGPISELPSVVKPIKIMDSFDEPPMSPEPKSTRRAESFASDATIEIGNPLTSYKEPEIKSGLRRKKRDSRETRDRNKGPSDRDRDRDRERSRNRGRDQANEHERANVDDLDFGFLQNKAKMKKGTRTKS